MKHWLTVLGAMALTTAMAGVNDLLITFSTPGPDKYADGTTVVDGETYALVYTAKGGVFEGFAADGSVLGEGSKLVVKVPLAKNGRCPNVMFAIDEASAKDYADGSFGVYLLDTRRQVAAGGKTVAAASATVPVVNGYAAAGETAAGAGVEGKTSVAAVAPVQVSTASGIPEGAGAVKIESIKCLDGYVYVTVSGTNPYLRYGLNAGDRPDAVTTAVGTPQYGKTSADETVVFVSPLGEGETKFYKVDRQ